MTFSPNNLGVIVCNHVRDNLRPVLLATHYEDGDWAFTCGESDHSDDSDDYTLVGVGHLTERDPSLNRISDLERGFCAERKSIGGDWRRSLDPG